jgi:sarcosine oxidase subunit delta
MRIACPFCGERGNEEFQYLGAAQPRRPEAADSSAEAWTDYIYVRDNPAGPNEELWHHLHGCRSWLVVTRDTRSHDIIAVRSARAAAGGA